jgi:outer membrane biosynthesis protein TonB
MSKEEARARGLIGSLEKEDIRQVIRHDLRGVRDCYERALTRQPGLFGRVLVQFVITGNGTVSDSRLFSSTLGVMETEVCIAERACTWRFPPTNGGGPVIVTYPFNLTTGSGPES